MNTLYYGDNLDVLRRCIADESVDLVYLDPPFKSDQNYNVLFAERDGTQAAAQIKAFKDTWRWDQAAARTYEEVVEAGGRVSQAVQAFRTFLGDTDLLAYLAMMAPRLVELRRVLTTAGSIYLHCDPTASHYLKMLMDAVFGPATFGSEIVWKRYGAHNDAKRYGAVHDIILFYSPDSAVFHKQHQPYDASYIEQRFRFTDADGRRWAEQNLASPNPRPNLTYAFTARNGITYQPPPNGWKYTPERMSNLEAAGRLHYPLKKGGRLRLKNYLGDLPGVAVQDIWTDVGLIGGTSPERLGYPTQKPQALLERIISASSNEGDTVLDPFCGCGTTIAAAQQLNRCWVGIDITSLATTLIKHRLLDAYGDQVPNTYEVIGEPVSLPDACTLAAADPYQFQWWALGLIGARPVEQKKGADKGIDGRLFFHDEGPGGKTKQIVVSVKAGKLHAPYVRDLRGVMDREQSEMGVLVSLEPPTAKMRTEAASAGFYESAWGKHPRLQIVTVGELLDGRKLDAPPPRQTSVTFKRAPKARGTSAEQRKIFE